MALKFDNIEEVSKSTEKIKGDTKDIKDNVDASNISLSDQLSLSKKIATISKQRERSEEGVLKSFTGVLANLVKGNFQEVISYGIKRKSLSLTQNLRKSTEGIAKHMETGGKLEGLSIGHKKQVLDLLKDINDGTASQIDSEKLLEELAGERGESYESLKEVLTQLGIEATAETIAADNMDKAMKRFLGTAGLVVAIFGSLAAIALKFSSMVDDIGKKFGALNISGAQFNDNIMSAGIEVSKLGGTIDDVASITSTLSSEFGIGRMEASEMSAQVFDISKGLALTTDETAKLIGMLMQTSDLSFQQAENLAESTFQLAAAAGVDAPTVLKDLANASEDFAGFTKDGGDNIARAAVQARALGTTLSTTAKIAEGLLDFENSISKEIEASVLIGRQLNLQKARELALNNDIEGAMKAVVEEMGSEAEFNKLNLLQRKALADSINVSTAELSKFVGESDKANAVGKSIGRSFTDILGKEGVSELTALMGEFNIFFASVAQIFGPVLIEALRFLNPLVSGFANTVQGMQRIRPTAIENNIGEVTPRAVGGPVNSNEAYMVGEKGPELFVSKAAGSIVPNNQLSTAQTRQPTPQPQTIILGTRVSGGDLIIASDLPNAGHKASTFDSMRP